METPTNFEVVRPPIKLADSKGLKPRFAKTVKSKDGQEVQVADPQITRGLLALMDAQAFLGGAASHWGGPAALSELMSSLYGFAFQAGESKKQKWFDCLQVINDAGHCENGIYALKANYGFAGLKIADLKGFRSIQSPLTGHGEAHLFPQGVYISNGPLGSSLPQAQGLSLADKKMGSETVTATVISDGACMEGEARESLAAIPGLAARGLMNPFILVISDNNTKLSGRIDEQSFSMQPTFQGLTTLGWKVIKLDEPHDLQKAYAAVEEAYAQALANPKVPVAIHAKTIKGYGLKHSEHSKDGGHGFHIKSVEELPKILDEIFNGQPMPDELKAWRDEVTKTPARKLPPSPVAVGKPTEKVQVGVSKAMIAMRSKGLPVVNITSDLPGSTGTASFQKQFPNDWIDVGVAESNMISVAAGLSKQGFIPVVDTFSQFGVTKGALPLTMASLSEAPLIAIFSHAGFQDAADGASHQALCYLAMTSALPYTKVIVLSTSGEAEALVSQAIEDFAAARKAGKTPSSYLFFLGRENFPQHYVDGIKYKIGQAQVVAPASAVPGKSLTIVASGPLVHQALEAQLLLKAKNVSCAVINASIINEPDIKTISETLAKTDNKLVTVEDHQVIGGMGAILVQKLMTDVYSKSNNALKVRCLGVKGTFGQSAHQAIDLYTKHGLDAEGIAKAAMEL
jgi:transketolase